MVVLTATDPSGHEASLRVLREAKRPVTDIGVAGLHADADRTERILRERRTQQLDVLL